MYKNISPAVTSHLSLLLALCDPATSNKFVIQLLKTADKSLLLAIGELILNSKSDTIPNNVRHILTKKGSKQATKRTTLIKQWKKIG